MSDYLLREAQPADRDFILDLDFHTTWESLSPVLREHVPPDQVRQHVADFYDSFITAFGNEAVVALADDGSRVGYALLGMEADRLTGDRILWIYGIAVVSDHRGQGVGASLMIHADEQAIALGCQRVGLTVAAHNYNAQRFYERLGFRVESLRMTRPTPTPETCPLPIPGTQGAA